MLHSKCEYHQIHNMLELAEDIESPGNTMEAAEELNPDYLTTRYVNATHGIAARIYTEKVGKGAF